MPIYFLLHEYWLNHGLILCFSNRLDLFYLSQCDLDQHESIRNIFDSNLESSQCDSNLQIFCDKFFNFKIIVALSIFDFFVASKVFHKVFTFIFHCAIPQRDPAERVEDVAVDQPDTGNLWVWASDGSRWVHYNFVIQFPKKINTHFVTTFPTPEGEGPITMFPSLNGSAHLVCFCDKLSSQLRTTYSKPFQPYTYRRQREMFYPSAVGVCQLIRCQYEFIFCGISPNRNGQLWYWWIVEAIFEMRSIDILVSCDLFLLTIFSIIFIAICSILLFVFGSIILLEFGSIVLLSFDSIVLLTIVLLFASFLLKGVLRSSWKYSSLPFCFFCGVILLLSTVTFATLLKCALFCSRYAVQFFLLYDKYQYVITCLGLCRVFIIYQICTY